MSSFSTTVSEQCFATSVGEMSVRSWATSAAVPTGRILALHGWLDNAASFDRLAPLLAAAGFQVSALDLPGHGHSDWLAGGNYYIWEPVAAVVEVARQLEGPLHLLGHSMGAATALLTAAAYPELARSVAALDALGPLTTPAEQLVSQLRKGVDDTLRRRQQPGRSKVYRSEEQAIQARVGKDPLLTAECIAPVVRRNLRQTTQGWSWRSDPGLRGVSKVRLTESQVASVLQAVRCPVQVVRAQQGIIPQAMFDLRLPHLQNGRFITLPGHHHFHLQADCCGALAQTLIHFYQDN